MPVDHADSPKHHALIGWLKGTVQLAPDVDLTEPADPECLARMIESVR